MKTRRIALLIAVLVLVFAFVAPVGRGPVAIAFAQEGVEQVDQAQQEPTAAAVLNTRPWSAVGSTCSPDDDSPFTRYEYQPSLGYAEFSANAIGYLYFDCNVTTPIDVWPGEPDWSRLVLTFKDPDAAGFVNATLIRKNLVTGGAAAIASVTSTNGLGVRQVAVAVGGFDFDHYAYFVRVVMYRTNVNSDQEFHIVRLQSLLQ